MIQKFTALHRSPLTEGIRAFGGLMKDAEQLLRGGFFARMPRFTDSTTAPFISARLARHRELNLRRAILWTQRPMRLLAGAFPIHVKDVGLVGTVTVSGLPHEEDQQFVVATLAEFLAIEPSRIALAS
jgi:uncharacterized protein (UPF0303 family)